jgi:hypothetical protein
MARLSITDTIWLATALLHLDHPEAENFDRQTILRKVAQLDSSLDPRSVARHLSIHLGDPAELRALKASPAEDDPILALAGVGKEMWRKLGGGEAFIRALRAEFFPGFEPSATKTPR